jgi:3-methylcrotonyl-CoA carboxylase alpha subunit
LLPAVDDILPSSKTLAMASLASLLEETNSRDGDAKSEPSSPWSDPSVSGLRLSGGLSRALTFDVDGVDASYEVQVQYRHNEVGFDMGVSSGSNDGTNMMYVTGTYDEESGDIVAMIDGVRCTGTVVRAGHNWHVFVDGEDVRSAGTDGTGDTCGRHMYTLKDANVKDYFADSGGSGALSITTPMPGKVVKVSCEVGDVVDKGTALLILEAMKMEHVIRAPADGMVVERLPFAVGEQVDDGSVLVAFKGEEEE